MEQISVGEKRRKAIIEMMQSSQTPLSGTEIGKVTGVSRQVVVQDIALLRTAGYPIVSTARGYLLARPAYVTRLVKVCHTSEQLEEELTTVVDLGGCVADVMVNHRAYGRISAPLQIKSRRDIQSFLEQICTGKSTPLLNITAGYHFHHITAEREDILDEIEAQLRAKGFLAEFLPYEWGDA